MDNLSFQDCELSTERCGSSIGNNNILEKEGELDVQVVCCGQRYWIQKAAALSEKTFRLSCVELNFTDETPLLEIADVSPIQMVERRLIPENKISFPFVMHTTAEDRGRLFRVDSAEEREEWILSIQKLSLAAKKEKALSIWKSMSSYQKAFSVVAKVQRHPTTSGVMCCFVFVDSLLTCVDKQLTEEEMGPDVVKVLCPTYHHEGQFPSDCHSVPQLLESVDFIFLIVFTVDLAFNMWIGWLLYVHTPMPKVFECRSKRIDVSVPAYP
jgi:hypothetical protein